MTDKREIFINTHTPALVEMAHAAGHAMTCVGYKNIGKERRYCVRLDGKVITSTEARAFLESTYSFVTHGGMPCELR